MNIKISGFSDEISPDIDEQFRHLQKLGIKYFEPRGVNGKNISELNDEEAYELKKKTEEYGIKASSIGSPLGKIGIEDDFEKHKELLRRVIRTAKILGCGYIRVFSFYIKDGNYEKHRDEVLRRMKEMTEIAAKENVILLHENEKGIYGDIPARCADILENIKSPSLGCVFDPANFIQCGAVTYPDAYEMLEKYITYMHIKDCKPDGTVVPSGYGAGHIKEILAALDKKGYSGFLSLEPHLGSFEGVGALEENDKMLNLSKSDAGKFTLAYESLKAVMPE